MSRKFLGSYEATLPYLHQGGASPHPPSVTFSPLAGRRRQRHLSAKLEPSRCDPPANTLWHSGLRRAFCRARQAVIWPESGMNCPQRRNASGVQACWASAVPLYSAKAGVVSASVTYARAAAAMALIFCS